ncbi:MAG: hypothetical protein IJ713_07440 [Oscillibacter sp.]|nr:hypothetical protein [Oscillibacter sp.]
MVGTDAFFREIAVGDEIRDIEDLLYTIDQFGRAKPLDGGNAVPLRNVKEPSVVRDYAGPDRNRLNRHRKRRILEPPPGEPSETVGKMPGATPQSPEKPRARGHRPNKTGFIRLKNLGVPFGLKCVEVREILEGAGIEIVPCGRKKESAIRKEDAPAAHRALDEWAEKHAEPLPESQPQLEPIPELLYEYDRDGRHYVSVTPPPTPSLGGFSDQDLADELRRRGYEVTAIKHVEL